jgi:hypothetical protein
LFERPLERVWGVSVPDQIPEREKDVSSRKERALAHCYSTPRTEPGKRLNAPKVSVALQSVREEGSKTGRSVGPCFRFGHLSVMPFELKIGHSGAKPVGSKRAQNRGGFPKRIIRLSKNGIFPRLPGRANRREFQNETTKETGDARGSGELATPA